MTTSLYEKDTYAWTQQQVALLANGEFDQADWPNIIEEIESLGKIQRSTLSGLPIYSRASSRGATNPSSAM